MKFLCPHIIDISGAWLFLSCLSVVNFNLLCKRWRLCIWHDKSSNDALFVSLVKHSCTLGSLCPVSVCPSVCMSGSHTFLVVTHSYVSQATRAFLGMLPLLVCWMISRSMTLWHWLCQCGIYAKRFSDFVDAKGIVFSKHIWFSSVIQFG